MVYLTLNDLQLTIRSYMYISIHNTTITISVSVL